MKVLLFLICIGAAASMKCSVDRDVQFILRNFNPTAVRKNVDCVVGIGACDSLGNKLKNEAPNAVRTGKCGSSCSCQQIQVRLVVNKMKREYPAQWARVEQRFS